MDKDIKQSDLELKEIPYFVHEKEMTRADNRFKCVLGFAILIFIALIGTNAGWIIYESQYEDVVTTTQTVTQDADAGGTNTFAGDFYGGSYYGEANGN